jgi:non-heme chloroperoxidase
MFSERTRRRAFYRDWGSGQPIVFSHGWPLSAQVADGHDMDHYADVKPRVLHPDGQRSGLHIGLHVRGS